MAHHVKGCSEDISPDTVILHQGTNEFDEWKHCRKNCCQHLALTIQSEKNKVFTSGLTISIKDLRSKSTFGKKMYG